jgi:hypothetical protein
MLDIQEINILIKRACFQGAALMQSMLTMVTSLSHANPCRTLLHRFRTPKDPCRRPRLGIASPFRSAVPLIAPWRCHGPQTCIFATYRLQSNDLSFLQRRRAQKGHRMARYQRHIRHILRLSRGTDRQTDCALSAVLPL